mmetsp:Transcript_130472/g.417490  ORF Transcript_130472/g.417490 Transcript_130472/m.417490 type:complete len:247 (+) Transcript_130472:112-852(+)
MQFEGSVLATLASTRWTEGAKRSNGHLFLDMDPDAFKEVLEFLRERRLARGVHSVFSPQAARLAQYLGVPVDSIKDELCISMKNTLATDCSFSSFMFDVHMPGQWGCCLRAISFESSESPGRVTVYMRTGSFLGEPQSDASQWSEVCRGPLQPGQNRIELPRGEVLHIPPCTTAALFLFFEGGAKLRYSSKRPDVTYANMSKGDIQVIDSMRLSFGVGRNSGTTLFSLGLHSEDRYFVGEVVYSLV